MSRVVGDWATQQLSEFLAVVSSATDETAAVRAAVERAAEAFDAEVGALLVGADVVSSVGFPAGQVPTVALASVPEGVQVGASLAGLGCCTIVVTALDLHPGGRLLLARAGDDRFSAEEVGLFRAMARVLALSVAGLRTLAEQVERKQLFEHLSRIQRSISHRRPLPEVLDAITTGAQELLRSEVVGLRLRDPEDPDWLLTVSTQGVEPELEERIRRVHVTEGVGGAVVLQDQLVVVRDYDDDAHMLAPFAEKALKVAMGAPVHENGRVVGSLVVATYASDRTYTDGEQEALIAFAEHTSLALNDAKTVEAMREADRSKDMFLAMVTHHLKTPLTVILGNVRTLQQYGPRLPPDVVEEMLAASITRGRELERLIDRMLRGAQADLAGTLQQASLTQLLEAAADACPAPQRLHLAAVANVVVSVDTTALSDILGLLLDNAARHSVPGSGVEIAAQLDRGQVFVRVSNEGALPAELDLEEVFRPFHQGSASGPGVGMGLYIAARLAESMGGRLRLRSAADPVVFELAFPATPPLVPPQPVASQAARTRAAAR